MGSDLRYEAAYVWDACRDARSPMPLVAKMLYHLSRLGKQSGIGVVSAPMQRLSIRLWNGVLINPKPLRGAALVGLLSLPTEADESEGGAG